MTAYRTIDVDGTEIFYREGGEPAIHTLLLLHGFPSSTFDRLADAIEAFTEAKGLDRFSLYMFDFGSPVGFRIATRHPERVQGLVLQNGNAYGWVLARACRRCSRTGGIGREEPAVRGSFPDATRSQYVDGVADPTRLNPDLGARPALPRAAGRTRSCSTCCSTTRTIWRCIRRGRNISVPRRPQRKRPRRWRPDPHGLAAAAAASGDPTVLRRPGRQRPARRIRSP